MKKFLGIFLVSFAVIGCATPFPVGTFYTEIKLPVQAVSEDASYSKVGVATSNTVLGIIATGDSSIRAAIQNGGIKKVKFIDWDAKNILGIIGEYKTTVYGD